MVEIEIVSHPICHSAPEPFAYCHSEGAQRPKNLPQGKLREGEESFALLRTASRDPSSPKATQGDN